MSKRAAFWLLASLAAFALLIVSLWLAGFGVSLKFIPVV